MVAKEEETECHKNLVRVAVAITEHLEKRELFPREQAALKKQCKEGVGSLETDW